MTTPDLFSLADPNFSALLAVLIVVGAVAWGVWNFAGLWRMRGRREKETTHGDD